MLTSHEPRPHRPQRSRRQIVRFVLALALLSVPAFAFDNVRAAQTMVQRAAHAYEEADYARAVELYSNAFRTDPVPAYLYGQARAEQLSGRVDIAIEHFRAFVELPRADPKQVLKAKEILAEIQRAALDKRVVDAETAARTGDYLLAAQVWQDVVKQAPSRVELLFRAGVALQQAGDLSGAMVQFEAYLAKAEANAPDRRQAQLRRDAIVARSQPQTRTPPPASDEPKSSAPDAGKPSGVQETQQGNGRTWLGWSLLGGGLAVGLGGLGVYLATKGNVDTYNADTVPGADGKVTTISFATAEARAGSIRTREGLALGLGIAGVACASVGVWILATDVHKTKTALRWVPGPTLAGAGVSWTF